MVVRGVWVALVCVTACACTSAAPDGTAVSWINETIEPSSTISRGSGGCEFDGPTEAKRLGAETVEIIFEDVSQCDVQTTTVIVIGHDGQTALEIDATSDSTANGGTMIRSTELDVQLSTFDAEGIVSGRIGDRTFWAVVDRPTMVDMPATGTVGLEYGQITYVDGCALHHVEPGPGRIADAVRTFGDCGEITIEVSDRSDAESLTSVTVTINS